MAKIILPLTSKQVKEAQPKPRAYKLYDGGGLILTIYPTGKKVWRLDYYDLNKKRKTYTIGDAQHIPLAAARKKRDELKGNLENHQSISKKDIMTFGQVFYEWFDKWKLLVVESTANRALSSVQKDCFPTIENLDITKIRPKDIVAALAPIDKRGAGETLEKTKSALKLTFDYAIARGLCDMNPVTSVTASAFTIREKQNHRALDPSKIYMLNDFFASDRSSLIVRKCTEFTLRTMCRISEAVYATWDEIDGDVWTIPAERMKSRRAHIVHLTEQSLEILEDMKKFKSSQYIFQNNHLSTHIHKDTPNTAINRCGIDSTVHGFRALASTVLNGTCLFDRDVIEMCLSHKDSDAVRAAYNRAQYLEHRKEALIWWSDFIDMCDTEKNNMKALKKFKLI
ncbi:tyrosine-type recombinase/integrase [Wohlfahrtiimonas chitiniclastica]|uniref:tyrosine-type recombinase/integrase n=1 Tax=Wohlfahrtiimonas chitiniclastica TaxID=400946 RepID=UPI000360159D|nr:integrase arm-type DNA-binding domain-containing protein [Wohlfahrtiimonas chitiniclastica]